MPTSRVGLAISKILKDLDSWAAAIRIRETRRVRRPSRRTALVSQCKLLINGGLPSAIDSTLRGSVECSGPSILYDAQYSTKA